MATMTLPRRINSRWLDQQKTKLACTARTTHDGEPNPNYTALAAEIEAAETDYVRWTAFLTWAKGRGLIINQYPTRTPAGSYDAGQVFLTAKDAAGKREVRLIPDVWAEYQESIQ